MSRFQEKSETVYVAYNPTELNQYSSRAYIEADCKNQISIYNGINNEFNPKIAPSLKQGDRITPTQPFFGNDGLSLQLDMCGNFFLRHITNNQVDGNLWQAGCPSTAAAISGVGLNFPLQGVYGCSGEQIVDSTFNGAGTAGTTGTTGNILLNPYCQIDLYGNLVCYGCTIASGKPTPYMSFVNTKTSVNDSTLNLIIDGAYSLPVASFGGTGTNSNMAGKDRKSVV